MSGNYSVNDWVLSGKDSEISGTDRILFVCTTLSSFVRGDLEILKERYRVKVLQVPPGSRFKQFFSILGELFYLLFRIKSYRFVYIWFADYHSFLPVLFCRILNKSSYVVAGGYDVCRIKKVGYGSFVNPVRGFMTKYSFSNCSRCICVSAHVERVVRAIAPSAKTIVIYNAISRVFTPDKQSDRSSGKHLNSSQGKSGVLSVASASSYQGIYIKGIDRYIEAARQNPDLSFTLVGCNREVLGKLPDNLILYPRLEQKDLKELYIRSKVYCQLSRSESFGVAMAEAMYYNCIPVYTSAGGLKEVAGEFGFMVSGKDPDEISSAIKRAHSATETPDSRERIGSLFTHEQRAERLLAIIDQER